MARGSERDKLAYLLDLDVFRPILGVSHDQHSPTPKEEGMRKDSELMIAWLNDAYAMENGLVPILKNHARDADRHPALRSRVEQHVEETRQHAELVKACLERLGEEPSGAGGTVGRFFGAMQNGATGPFHDEDVKNGLLDYATEHFEIAAYRSLIEGARTTGDEETAHACEQILRDELEMARFLYKNLPTTVRDTIQGEA